MSAEELKELLSTPLALFILMLGASFGSAVKQIIVSRNAGGYISLREYFFTHWPETVVMLGTNIGAFIGLIMTDALNWASALGVGYAANDAADLLTKKGRSDSITPTIQQVEERLEQKKEEQVIRDELNKNQGGFIRPGFLMPLCCFLVIVLNTFALNGCAAFDKYLSAPDQKEQSFAERLRDAYLAVASARRVGDILVQAEKISIKDGRNLQRQLNVVRDALDVADEYRKIGNVPNAESKLAATLLILEELETYLKEQQKLQENPT